jgi:DNA-binding GntR family transcriptional regulator
LDALPQIQDMPNMEQTVLPAKNDRKSGGTGNTLATSVYDRMREDILTGNLPPGDKLRADFLRARYEVGTSPMREALNRLAADGLVVHEDQRGFRVSAVSTAELGELLKTRCWLEEIALRQSIANGDAAWEEAIVLSFHRLSRQPRSASEASYTFNPEWEKLHHEFHRNLLSACGSRWLVGYCDQLNDQTLRYRQIAAQVDDPRRNEVDEHREIMEATIARDAEPAVKLLIRHFEDTNELIRNHVPDMADAAAS